MQTVPLPDVVWIPQRSPATEVVYLGSVAKANESGVDSVGELWFSAVMPIYEYTCPDCESPFEEIVRSSDTAVRCPHCGGDRVERQLSVFASRSGGSSTADCDAGAASGPVAGGCCGGGCGRR